MCDKIGSNLRNPEADSNSNPRSNLLVGCVEIAAVGCVEIAVPAAFSKYLFAVTAEAWS